MAGKEYNAKLLAHADVISMKSGMGHLVIFYPHSIEHIIILNRFSAFSVDL